MTKLPHETLGWDAIYDGSWKNSPSYRGPTHITRRWKTFLGIYLPMRHIFDIRELFVSKEDFVNGYNHPTYKQCWNRFWRHNEK